MDDRKMRVSQVSRITGEDGETLVHKIEGEGCLRGDLLTFTETAEQGAKVFHRISLGCGELTVRRTGAVVSTVRFAEGERDLSVYRIPPYASDMAVETERLELDRAGEGLSLRLVFRAEIGGSRQRTELCLTAEPREDAP
jgi:uncharacterized beta-barrel protein YwiB (DUF1934 family)